ncbi:hypothetical protein KIL84_003665 [Mauremys mutica]|uniref:Uncharacterized protein n=1 Tax=Mauremys mutica TaxID=74926 RepID=A0A9D3WW65_9SAUR|nr:hypothetical protein KIL84_003665 [Mauremys mutica]
MPLPMPLLPSTPALDQAAHGTESELWDRLMVASSTPRWEQREMVMPRVGALKHTTQLPCTNTPARGKAGDINMCEWQLLSCQPGLFQFLEAALPSVGKGMWPGTGSHAGDTDTCQGTQLLSP